jgi:hypothetical protein
VLVISNTHFPMMEWVHDHIGGSFVPIRKKKGHWKTGWQVVLGQRRAAGIIRACRPHLIVKAPQADLALSFMDDFVNNSPQRRRPSEAQVALRKRYYEQSLRLNGGHRSPRKKRDA